MGPGRLSWPGRSRLPADVRTVLAAAPGERVAAWGRDEGGAPLVATDRGLWGYGERLAWTDIDHVRWADGVMTILAIDGQVRRIRLAEPGRLPPEVRQRVERTVLASRAVPFLPDGRGVTVVARRQPGGPVLWRMRYDPEVPSSDPELNALAGQALAAMRAELGL